MRLVTLTPGHEHPVQPAGNTARPGPFVGLAVAAGLFAVAYHGGGYSPADRATVGIAVVWTVMLGLALGLWPRERIPPLAFIAGGLLCGYAALAGISIAWSDSAENAFAELTRGLAYVAVFALAVLASRHGSLGSWLDGLALAIAAVAVVAFASRLAPDLFGAGEQLESLRLAQTRLSFPVGYWNGLAIALGLGAPLLLRSAIVARSGVTRGLALSSLPALAAAVYLTSSRGGVATLLFATFAFLVLTSRRTTAFLAACAAFAGSAAAVAVLLHADEFVDSPLGSAAAGDQAPGVATGVALACALTGAVWGLGTRLAASRGSSPPLVDRIVLAIVLAVGAGAVVAIDPVGRFEAFKNPISEYSDEYVRSHLLSSTGSGRWQFWEAAVDSFRSAPLTGRGAGSYEAWWAQHGSLAHFVRDAHSLYLESLAELGAAGGLLITLGLAAGIYGLATRVLRVTGDARASVAAAGGAFAGFVFAVGIDWMWELTVVGCIGMILLGLLTGPATMPPKGIRHGTGIKSQFRGPWLGSALAALAIGWALMIVMAIPLLAELQLGESQAAASRGDARAALTSAVRAARVEPWAATPYLQLALVQEQTGQVRRARLSIEQAIERDRSNWRLWLVAARIQTKLGDVAAAQTSFSRARTLNPRSPLFAPEGR